MRDQNKETRYAVLPCTFGNRLCGRLAACGHAEELRRGTFLLLRRRRAFFPRARRVIFFVFTPFLTVVFIFLTADFLFLLLWLRLFLPAAGLEGRLWLWGSLAQNRDGKRTRAHSGKLRTDFIGGTAIAPNGLNRTKEI